MNINDFISAAVDMSDQTGEENTPDPLLSSTSYGSEFVDPISAIPSGPSAAVPSEPAPVVPSEPAPIAAVEEGPKPVSSTKKKWEMWDEARGIPADQFRKTATETLQKLEQASGKKGLASPDAVELLLLTAANETQVGRYQKAPGKSKQRGVMQITDDTIEDLYRYMSRTPALKDAVDSLRNPNTPITSDVETNLPLSLALARVKYMMDKQAIPVTPEAQSQYYKRIYNSNHPAAKATPKTALKNYIKYA
jgi:hypothetical protein